MKSKEEILKMSLKDLKDYQWSDDLNRKMENKNCSNCSDCSDCSNCSNCSNCFNCFNCSDCYLCRNAIKLKYAICNVKLTKEEYKQKMKELEKEKENE